MLFYHLKPELLAATGHSLLVNFLFGKGFLGVDLFFILSGFILAYNYHDAFNPLSKRDYLKFLSYRIARIYPVHFSMLIAYLISVIGIKVLGWPITMPGAFTVEAFVRNLILIQAWSFETQFSWNAPAWSVSCEWMAYLVFPLLVLLSRRSSGYIKLLTGILASVMLIVSPMLFTLHGTAGYGFLRILFEFPIGCLLFHAYKDGYGKEWNWSLIIPVLILGVFSVGYFFGKHSQILLAAPLFAPLILGLAYGTNPLSRLLSCRLLVIGGYISYSVYMVHELVLLISRKIIRQIFDPNSASVYLIAVPIIVGLVWFLAWLMFHYIEEPARALLRKQSKRFFQR